MQLVSAESGFVPKAAGDRPVQTVSSCGDLRWTIETCARAEGRPVRRTARESPWRSAALNGRHLADGSQQRQVKEAPQSREGMRYRSAHGSRISSVRNGQCQARVHSKPSQRSGWPLQCSDGKLAAGHDGPKGNVCNHPQLSFALHHAAARLSMWLQATKRRLDSPAGPPHLAGWPASSASSGQQAAISPGSGLTAYSVLATIIRAPPRVKRD